MSATIPGPDALRPLAELRRRLTVWYVATFCAILLLLGGGLFLMIHHQLSRQLDDSLSSATQELIRAARIREMESARVRGPVVDALDELRIPERTLFLLDTGGRPIKPDTASAWIQASARHAARTGSADAEQEITGDRTLRVHAQRFTLENGAPLVALALADDIELEHRYAALIATFGGAALVAMLLVTIGASVLVRQSTDPIQRAVAHMRRFMADAAHELRTPLAVVRSRAEVALQQRRTPDEYTAALRAVEHETEHLGGIVDQLLLLARADTGELPLARERVFLDDVALEAAHTAHALARRKGVELSLPRFDEAPVMGDPRLLRQLIMILLDNAVKFTPAGGHVELRVFTDDRDAGRPMLEVSDTGPGIAPEHQPHVFDRFFRADPARTRSEGAGLGLAIARWIADEHGAVITVRSAAGRGTRMAVAFQPAQNGAEHQRPGTT